MDKRLSRRGFIKKSAVALGTVVGCDEESVSVAIEEMHPKDWKEKVYDPLILRKMGTLYKKPGYSM